MLRDDDVYRENLALLLASWPEEPLDGAARDGALRALLWLLEPIGGTGVLVKIAAVRFLLRIEPRSMEKVAREYGVTRQSISKAANNLAPKLRLPPLRSRTSRENYRQAQLRAWQKRKAKLHGDNGQI